MEFDGILTQYVGAFGKYQLLFYFWATSVSVLLGLSLLDYAFIAAEPPYWCHVPELNTYNFTQQEIELFVSPTAADGSSCDACSMYVRDYANVTEHDIEQFVYENSSHVDLPPVTACTSWQFDDSIYTSTVVTEFQLVCDRSWMTALSQSIFMMGQFTVIISGFLTDRFGRRTVALVALVVHIAARLVTAFAFNYFMFVAGRLLTSVVDIAWYSALYVFAVEIVGPKWRVLSGMTLYYWWLVAYVVLAAMAYVFRGWRLLVLATTAVCVPYLIHFCILPESPRWLAANGKSEQARHVFQKMATVNKRWVPNDLHISSQKEEKNVTGSILDLFKSWYFIKITLVFFFQWNTTTLVYYGLTFYTPSLGDNPYISLMLSGLIEVPACIYAQFSMDTRLGRRINLIMCFWLSGGVLLAVVFVPKDLNWLLVTMAVLGKWGVSANFSLLYMVSTEVYPTQLRNIGLSACSMSGRIGSVISPFISQLTKIHPSAPSIFMGSMAIIAGALGVFLPETRGKNMPDTVAEATRSTSDADRVIPEEEIHLNEKLEKPAP